MEITEVRIKLMESSEDRLRGFCSITFDSCFVVRDLKIIDGNSGPFVAMPSRKLTSNCGKCRTKNHMRANYCNNCGHKLKHIKPQQGPDGRAKLYADIAHPINARCREMIQNRVIEELEKERKLAAQPGYRSRYDESYDSGPVVTADELEQDKQTNSGASRDRPADKHGESKPDHRDSARSDSAHQKSPQPHEKPPEQSQSKARGEDDSGSEGGARDDFGKGIFD